MDLSYFLYTESKRILSSFLFFFFCIVYIIFMVFIHK